MNLFMTLAAVDIMNRRRVFHNGTCWMLGEYVDESYANRYRSEMDERAFQPIDRTQTLADRGEQPFPMSPRREFTSIEQLLGDDVYNLEERFRAFILNQLAQFGRLTGEQICTMVQESSVAKEFIERWGSGEVTTFYLSRAVSEAWHDLAASHVV
jgi:hypothetical protein